MMAMKDLFYLVNAFMNRNKSTEGDEDREIEVPIEAAEDTRVLPGSNTSKLKSNSTLLSTLEPYQHLLPDLCGMDLNQQKKLQKALYHAGVSATLSLHKLLQEAPKRKGPSENSANPEECISDDIDGKEILEHLSKSVLTQEDPTKTIRFMSQNMDEIMQAMDGGKRLMSMISNELAAASLAAFASVTLRKPLTKQVESMMQTAQEMGPSMLEEEEEDDEQSDEDEDGDISDSSEEPPPAGALKKSASTDKSTTATIPANSATNLTAAVDGEKQQRPASCSRTGKGNSTNEGMSSSRVAAMANGKPQQRQRERSNTYNNVDSTVVLDETFSIADSNEPVEDELEDEDSLFRYVCAAGYEDLAKLLVKMRNSAEFSQQCDSTPLMEACCGGHADVVRTLLQAGADVNALSSTRNTALIYACASGHIECVRELLSTGRCELDMRNDAGHDAFMEASSIGNVELLKLLIQYGAKPSCVMENQDYKESALTLAAYKGHYETVEYLLSLMPKEKNAQEEEELHTALMEAAMDGHVNVARLLLDNGAKVNLSTESFENPLTLAACGGNLEMVKLLCERGANLEEPNDEGYTPLMEASREGHMEVVEFLLDKGADVNAKIEEGVETSLTLAASGGFKNVVELLVGHGGDLCIGERTPLFEACQAGHVDCAKFIVQSLRKSLSLAEIQKDLNEALLCSAEIDSSDLCNLLIDSGAQIDCFSKDNRTPLMEASRQNCLSVVELLLKKGADVNKIAPNATKDVDPGTTGAPTKIKGGGSKKLTQKDCCPTLKCPCCIPPSLQKSAKEVCTAAGIPPAPYSTSTSTTVAPTANAGTGKRPMVPSRSSTPSGGAAQHKCTATKSAAAAAAKQQRSLSNSSSSATLSDPTSWMDNTAPTCDAQNNDTALTLACVGGHTGLVSLLIKRGAHIEHRDKKGFTPLILAATGGHVEISRLLIEAGVQVDAQADRTKDTALSMACSGGRKEMVDLLLNHSANKEHRNLSDYTPLSLAASGGYVDIIQLLLAKEAEINSRTNSKLGISPLMLAAMNGHEEATRLLLEKGSDINAQIETNKNTALTLACFQGRAEVAKLLIQFGANVEHRAKTGLTPLMEAANGGYVEVGRVLLYAGADVNAAPVPTSRDTALTIAADKGHHTIVSLLLEFDAQINARNKKGCTALWLACQGGHFDTVKVLVDHKADTEAQDNRKLTPLMVAFRKGHHQVVEYMVEHVTQFPSDADCQRFILAQTDQDLITKCTQCIAYIKKAKSKQAEQANKAAASLLEQLAHEEALEESRKRTKQRQKEKKKAKKQAKKEGAIADDSLETILSQEEEIGALVEEKEEEVIPQKVVAVEAAAPEVSQNQPPKGKQLSAKKEQKAAAQRQKRQQLQVEQAPKAVEPAQPKAKEKSAKVTSSTSSSQHQQNNSKKESHQTLLVKSSHNGHGIEQAMKKPSGKSPTIATEEEEDEWLRASKKRASIVKAADTKSAGAAATHSATPATQTVSVPKTMATTTSSILSLSAAAAVPPITPLFPEDDSLLLISGRRPSLQVLNIAANAIPRVIGRAGANVNMIREATGAHVEVEKQSLRKEQAHRKITIKGSPEAVKNAVRMVEMLMKDHNLLINEIVDRVMSGVSAAAAGVRKSPSLSTSSETSVIAQQQQQQTPPISQSSSISLVSAAAVKTPQEEMRKLSLQQQTPLAKVSTGVKQSHREADMAAHQNAAAAPATTPTQQSITTNVWQKRAEAIREKRVPPQINLTVGEHPFSRGIFSAASETTMESGLLSGSAQNTPIGTKLKLLPSSAEPRLPASAGVIGQQHHNTNSSELASLSKEEHQRKAPGYARPQSSASINIMPATAPVQLINQKGKTSADGDNFSASPSLFDVFAAKWTSNPLDSVDPSEDSTAAGNIQNSWSYLLEERKSTERPQQTMQSYQMHLRSSPLMQMPPPPMDSAAIQQLKPTADGRIWQQVSNNGPSSAMLTSNNGTTMDNSSSGFTTPVKGLDYKQQPTPKLGSGAPLLQQQTNAAALFAQSMTQQRFSEQQQQRLGQHHPPQQLPGPADPLVWTKAPPAFVTPTILPQAGMPTSGPANRFTAAQSPSFQIQQRYPMQMHPPPPHQHNQHSHPPPGFVDNLSTQQGYPPFCQLPPQQHQQHSTLPVAVNAAFPPPPPQAATLHQQQNNPHHPSPQQQQNPSPHHGLGGYLQQQQQLQSQNPFATASSSTVDWQNYSNQNTSPNNSALQYNAAREFNLRRPL